MPVAVLANNAIVMDNNTNVTPVGSWPWVTNTVGDYDAYGGNYRTHAAGTGTNSFTWLPTLTATTAYRVYARWSDGPDRATNATYEVTSTTGTTSISVNQRQNGGRWILLGLFNMGPGQGHKVKITDNADGLVVADAIKFIPADAGSIYSIHTDHLNTPRAVKNSVGTVVWRWDSEPFGNFAPDQDPDGDAITFSFPLRFPGQYYDGESGLHYNYHRNYDPQTGRYLESDPVGLVGGVNTYAYIGGNPLADSDPQGLNPVSAARIGYLVGTAANEVLAAVTGLTLGGIIYDALNPPNDENSAYAKGGKDQGRNWATEEAKSRAKANCSDPCDELDKMLEDAKRTGNTKVVRDIDQAQKFLHCRNIRKRNSHY